MTIASYNKHNNLATRWLTRTRGLQDDMRNTHAGPTKTTGKTSLIFFVYKKTNMFKV